MMKRMFVWLVMAMFLLGVAPAFAKQGGKSGPSPDQNAYEHANENARFKRTGDTGVKVPETAEEKAARKEKKKAGKEAKKVNKHANRGQTLK